MSLSSSAAPVFRGENLHDVFAALEECESQVGVFGTNKARRKRVFPDGQSQVEMCSSLQRLANWKIWARVLIGRQRIRGQFASLRDTQCFADRIRIKNNALAFYSAAGLVCKFWLASGVRGHTDLQTEARTIRKVEQLSFVRVPKILHDNSDPEKYGVPAIWFEAIDGATPGAGEETTIAALELAKSLVAWYGRNSVDHTASDTLCAQGSTSLYNELVCDEWRPQEAEQIVRATETVRNSGTSLPVSMIHGDASVGNTIRDSEGALVVLDWESSRKDIIAHDMPKLIIQGGDAVRNTFEKWLSAIGHADMLPLDHQLSVVRIFSNLKLADKEANLKRVMPEQEIAPTLSRLKKSVLSECKALRDGL